MNFTIRLATRNDVEAILTLIRGIAEYEKLSHEVVATRKRIEKTLFAEKPFAECLLAESCQDEQSDASVRRLTVGFALFFHNYSTFLGQPGIHLEDLFVLPEYRGQGIGKKLLQSVAHVAVARNCGRMEWSVLDWNQSAIDFYDSLGAVPMKQWFNYRLTGETLQNVATAAGNPDL